MNEFIDRGHCVMRFLFRAFVFASALFVLENRAGSAETPVAMEDWQTSYPAFASRVGAKQTEFGASHEPGTTEWIRTMANAGCESSESTLAGFGQVQFQATFESMSANKAEWKSQRVHNAEFRIELDVDGDIKGEGSDDVQLFIYAANDSNERWKTLSAGAKIAFTANVNCIINLKIPSRRTPDLVLHLVTLHDARPVNVVANSYMSP